MLNKSPRRNRLIEARIQKGLLQKDIASMLGVTTSFYGMIEQGTRTPKLREALAIQEILGKPLRELFSDLEPNLTLGKRLIDHVDLNPTDTDVIPKATVLSCPDTQVDSSLSEQQHKGR